ncbi:hypothetical protein COU58_02865 [Candidatus Pacearchaeota archaeon CG10_big_fil_rev_8_21_14_0_10_32_42]|nr:MAG: hypothetical protein COU58_02865 [Candidatus Pacearchaeota archaeon CG10_big_fil_rev_8_21_14_0_10_32_42]
MEEDLTLPEEKFEKDSKVIIEEGRIKSKKEEKILRKQKEFEYRQVEEKGSREQEYKKESLKAIIFKFVVGGLAIVFLIFLYFWLLV